MKTPEESESELIEELADLEHEQWVEWSTTIAANEKLSLDRLNRWSKLWATDYKDLTDEQKEQDRVWARKIIKILNKRTDICYR